MSTVTINASSRPSESQPMRGIWWLPADPERTIGGQLTFVEREGGRLELLGGFFGQDAPQVPVVIFGTVAGKAITVCDASYQGRSTTQDWRTGGEETVTSESWACYDVFVGIHSSEGSAQRFDAFILETAMLPVWVNKPRVDTERKEGSTGGTIIRYMIVRSTSRYIGGQARCRLREATTSTSILYVFKTSNRGFHILSAIGSRSS